jgi:hypothetical protein
MSGASSFGVQFGCNAVDRIASGEIVPCVGTQTHVQLRKAADSTSGSDGYQCGSVPLTRDQHARAAVSTACGAVLSDCDSCSGMAASNDRVLLLGDREALATAIRRARTPQAHGLRAIAEDLAIDGAVLLRAAIGEPISAPLAEYLARAVRRIEG